MRCGNTGVIDDEAAHIALASSFESQFNVAKSSHHTSFAVQGAFPDLDILILSIIASIR